VRPLGGRPPLELRDPTVWDPRAEYWDDPDGRLPDWWTPIMAAGPRISYEFEQVLPGLDDDAWFDPILDAVDDAHAGDARGARRKLHALLEADPRCLDAHAHLGWLQPEPDQALGHYQAGIAIAELSLPDGFDGVLPWGGSTIGRSCVACMACASPSGGWPASTRPPPRPSRSCGSTPPTTRAPARSSPTCAPAGDGANPGSTAFRRRRRPTRPRAGLRSRAIPGSRRSGPGTPRRRCADQCFASGGCRPCCARA
jgi:hypothetical protein